MAECLVTTGGTSGTFKLEYDLGSNHVVSYYNYDDEIYISDTATNVTYTTLTGDVTASSGCVTITARNSICYLLAYDVLRGNTSDYDPKFDAILIDTTVYNITETSIRPEYMGDFVYAVNSTLDDSDIKLVSAYSERYDDDYVQIDLIIKITGGGIPSLRIKTPHDNYLYIKGTVSTDCIPTDYVPINSICNTNTLT